MAPLGGRGIVAVKTEAPDNEIGRSNESGRDGAATPTGGGDSAEAGDDAMMEVLFEDFEESQHPFGDDGQADGGPSRSLPGGDSVAPPASEASAPRSTASTDQASPSSKSGLGGSGKKMRRLTSSSKLGGDDERTTPEATTDNLQLPAMVHEHEWESKLPLVSESLDAELPSGMMFGSIARIRETVNKYTSKTTLPEWYTTFKVPTIQALEKRLSSYSEKLVGRYHCDIQVGFKQVCVRVQSLLDFHKCMRSWVTSQDDTMLAKTLPSYKVIKLYLDKTEQSMYPDLQVLMTMAAFYECFDRTNSVHESLATVDFESLTKCVQKLAEEGFSRPEAGAGTSSTPSAGSATTKDTSSKDESAADSTEAKPAAKKRKRFQTESLESRLNFTDAPLKHMGTMIVTALKMIIFAMKKGFTPDELKHLLREVQSVQDDWKGLCEKAATADKEFGLAFAEILRSMALAFQCCEASESDRPPSSDVRGARRTILGALRGEGPCTELAKSMLTYESAQFAMEAARIHSSTGLSDEAAGVAFKTALQTFEDNFSGAFDDLGQWLEVGADGSHQTMASIKLELAGVCTMATHLAQAIDRWSSSALQEQHESIEVALNNMLELVEAGTWIMLYEASEALFGEGAPLHILTVAEDVRDGGSTGMASAVGTTGDPTGDAPEAGPTTPPACSLETVDLGAAANAAQKFDEAADEFTHFLHELASQLLTVSTTLAGRLGDKSITFVGAEPSEMVTNIRNNMQSAKSICNYIRSACEVARKSPLLSCESSDETIGDICNETFEALLTFARLHSNFVTTTVPAFVCKCAMPSDENLNYLKMCIDVFMGSVGTPTYDKHATSFITGAIKFIHGGPNKLSIVDESVMAQLTTKSLLGSIIVSPKWDQYLPTTPMPFDQCPDKKNLEHLCDQLAHNQMLKRLLTFVQSAGSETCDALLIPCGDISKPMAWSMSGALLRTKCMVRDVCMLAAILQDMLLDVTSQGQHVEQDNLYGYLTKTLALLQVLLLKLDQFLEGKDIHDMEMEGWAVDPPMAFLRQWRKCMSIFAGRCQHALLVEYTATLQTACEKCRSICPDWRAVFGKNGAEMNLALADKLLRNKLKALVHEHNVVFSLMKHMSAGAALLELSPRIQDHDLTSEIIAVAQSCLLNVSMASTVCMGVELLGDAQCDPQGPARAGTFIEKHKTAKNADIPAAFWRELDLLRNSAGSAQSSMVRRSGSSSSVGDPAVKREVPTPTKPTPSLNEVAAGGPGQSSGSAAGVAVEAEVAPAAGDPSSPPPPRPALKRMKRL